MRRAPDGGPRRATARACTTGHGFTRKTSHIPAPESPTYGELRSVNESSKASPSICSQWTSSPHWNGEPTPAGGGGRNGAIDSNMPPTPLDFRQAVNPGGRRARQTRASSAATRSWSGAKMTPGGRHHVEARIGVLRLLAVADLEREVEPELVGAATRRLDQRRRGGRTPSRLLGVPRGTRRRLHRSRGRATPRPPRRKGRDERIMHVRDVLGDETNSGRAPDDGMLPGQLRRPLRRHYRTAARRVRG